MTSGIRGLYQVECLAPAADEPVRDDCRPGRSNLGLSSAIWALLAAASFAVMMASVRYMDGKFDAFEIVFPRADRHFIVIRWFEIRIRRAKDRPFAGTWYARCLPCLPWRRCTTPWPSFRSLRPGADLPDPTVHDDRRGHRVAQMVFTDGCNPSRVRRCMVIIRPGVADVSLPILLVVPSSALYAGRVERKDPHPDRLRGGDGVLDEPADAAIDSDPAGILLDYAGSGGYPADRRHGAIRLGGAFFPGARLQSR